MALGSLVLSGTALLPTKLGKAPTAGARSGGFITPMPSNNTTKRTQAPADKGR